MAEVHCLYFSCTQRSRLNKTNNFYCFVRVIVKRNWLFCLNWSERGGEEHRGSSTCLAGAEDQPRHHHGLCVTSAIACKRQISLIITVKIPLLWRPCQKGTKEPKGSVEHTWRTSRTAKDPNQLKETKREIEKLPPSSVHWCGWFQCPWSWEAPVTAVHWSFTLPTWALCILLGVCPH